MGMGRVCGANLLETSVNKQQGARRSPMERRIEPPLVWQREMLYHHGRDSSMVEEGGQLNRRVVF